MNTPSELEQQAAAVIEQNEAEKARKIRVTHSPRNGRVLYGWEPTDKKPVRDGKGELVLDIHGKPLEEQLPFGQFLKKYSHAPQEIVLGAPKRGGFFASIEPKNRRQLKRHNQCKPTRYMVWSDRSLRRIDKVLKKQLESMTPEQQTALIEKARKIEEAQKAA